MVGKKEQKNSKVSLKASGGDGNYDPSPPDSDPGYVIKSPMDPNDYKSVTLDNGLKALLISTCRKGCPLKNSPINPDTGVFIEVENFNEKYLKLSANKQCPKEAKHERKRCKCENKNPNEVEETNNASERGCGLAFVSIAVGAGHLHNPEDFPGMAHFYEHVCFLFGSKKYPEPGLGKYTTNSGYTNAFTGEGLTNYHFSVDLGIVGEDRFKLGVDMLADTIINPLLPANDVYNEIHAVDSEFSQSETNDYARISELFNSTWPEGHPFRNFAIGIYETLAKPNLLERIMEWKQRHYVANNTTVVIQAAIPLQELEQMIQESFRQFPTSSLPKPSHVLFQKYGNSVGVNFNKMYKMVPGQDVQMALIQWELPSKFTSMKTKPFLYLQQYLSREGEGTLTEYLKAEHFAYSMTTHYWPHNSGYPRFGSTICVQINLTDYGLEEFNQVIVAVYSYIRMIASGAANEDLFTQIQMESADDFHYNEIGRSDLERLWELSANLHIIDDPKYILTTSSLVTEFNEELLEDIVNVLTPENMNVILVSKSFKGKCREKEKWYKTEYSSTEFCPALIKQLKVGKMCNEFKPLRGTNPYRVTNLICSLPRLQAKPVWQILLENSKASVYFMKINFCSDGHLPVGKCIITIGCPLIRETPMGLVLMRIWYCILLEKLAPTLQLPNQANINTWIWQQGTFFQLYLGGAAKHLTKVAQMILDVFMDKVENIDEQTFCDYKKLCAKLIMGSNATSKSETFALSLMQFLQTNKYLLKEQLLEALNGVTFTNFRKLVKTFRERMYISALLIGCISEANARTLCAYIDMMKYRELPEMFPANPDPQILQLPRGERCLRVKNICSLDHTSTVLNYYQFGLLGEDNELLLEKLIELMRGPAFAQLRAAEHLSYSRRISLWNNGLYIIVIPQPHRHTTGYVDERIDSFLVNFRRHLACYDNVFASPLNPNASLIEMTREHHQLLLKIYDDYLLPSGANYRKVSIQVVGTPNPMKKAKPVQENVKIIQDKMAMIPPFSFSFNPPSKLSVKYDNPDEIGHENGYFLTNIEAFKESLPPFTC